MSTENDPEDPTTAREDDERAESAEGAENVESAQADETAQGAEPEADESAPAPESTSTSIYVRRGRTPTLGFWVALAIALPAVAALISAPFFDFPDLGAVVNFVLMAAVMVGLPLAALAALIDAIRHRSPRSRRR